MLKPDAILSILLIYNNFTIIIRIIESFLFPYPLLIRPNLNSIMNKWVDEVRTIIFTFGCQWLRYVPSSNSTFIICQFVFLHLCFGQFSFNIFWIVFSITQNVLMQICYTLGKSSWTIFVFPDKRCNMIRTSKYFIAYFLKITLFYLVYADKDNPIIRQKIPCQHQP